VGPRHPGQSPAAAGIASIETRITVGKQRFIVSPAFWTLGFCTADFQIAGQNRSESGVENEILIEVSFGG
jgi:hypothetical protein